MQEPSAAATMFQTVSLNCLFLKPIKGFVTTLTKSYKRLLPSLRIIEKIVTI